MANPGTAQSGLRDIVAAASSVCTVDGNKGVLRYRGIKIEELAEHSTFEETTYFLLYERLPKKAELEEFSADLASKRAVPAMALELLGRVPAKAQPMNVLGTLTGMLALHDPDAGDNSREANLRKVHRLVAQIGTLTAAYARLHKGQPLVAPDPSLSHAGNFLYMLTGEKPSAQAERTFDVALILHADHELNASTFTARIVASTLSDVYSTVMGGIGALAGPLHGGANQRVLEMLFEIGEVGKAEQWIDKALEAKRRIPGFGHAVYKAMDPRAASLRNMGRALADETGVSKWLDLSEHVEKIVWEKRQLYPNVDFYSASVFYQMGIEPDLFPLVFATSRISGWSAHVLEQLADNKLIRPIAEYTGPASAEYVPIEKR
jgi:citrate synthase